MRHLRLIVPFWIASSAACAGGSTDAVALLPESGTIAPANDASPHDWALDASLPESAVTPKDASPPDGDAAVACRQVSYRSDAYAFELRITSTSDFYKLDFPSSSMLHCIGQRALDAGALFTKCEASYFFKTDAGVVPAAAITESFDVLVPFVPASGIDLTISAGGTGATQYELRGFDGTAWASFTSAQKTFHLARENMVPGGLASRLSPWPLIGPKKGAYMFPWYGTPQGPTGRWVHWDPASPTLYTPSKGLYDSRDPSVIAQQMAEARAAGLDLFVVSYWDTENPPLDEYLKAADPFGIDISAMLETSTRSKASRRESVLAQLALLRDTYGAHPRWLKAAGKPIVFVYSRIAEEIDQAPVGPSGWDDWLWIAAGLEPNVPVVMFPLGGQWASNGAALFGGAFAFAANSGGGSYYTGSHGDDFAWSWTARQKGALLAIPILPSIGRLRTADDEPNYRNQWHAARSVMPDMIIVNSWNEYHESTIIEPTSAFGTRYLDLTAEEAAKYCAGDVGTLLQ
jgi:hypothetical protein